MWAAALGLLVEIVKLFMAKALERRRLTETERELAEQAHDRATSTAKAELISARDKVRKEREAARKFYEKATGSSDSPDSGQ